MMGTAEELKREANDLFTKGQYEDALKIYKKCLVATETSTSMRGIVFRNMAQCYLNIGNYKCAIEAASSALNVSSGDTKALYRRSLAYEKCGQLKEALADVQMLVRIDSKNKAANELAFRLQSCVLSATDEMQSLSGKINAMFIIIQDKNSSTELLTTALNNFVSLIIELQNTAAERIWSHPGILDIFELCHHSNADIVFLTHNLLAVLIEHNEEYELFVNSTTTTQSFMRTILLKDISNESIHIMAQLNQNPKGLQLLENLTPQYFIGKVFSVNEANSADMCKFLRRLLESLTQVKSYHKKKTAAFKAHNKDESKPQGLVARNIFPAYKLDSKIQKPVENILYHIIKAINSYRLEAGPRESLLELLTWIIPEETGIDWAKQFFSVEGSIERLLEVAAAASASVITKRPVACKKLKDEEVEGDPKSPDCTPAAPSMYRGGILKTSSNTRLTVACLLSRIFGDLISDKLVQAFNKQCADFVFDLLTDKFIESKVEAAAVIGTLFSGPFDVGSFVLAREGIIEGLVLLAQCENIAYQTVALDTIILATNKKDKCMAIIDQAVPILRQLYKTGDDAIKVRALVGLCKLGALGGTDASTQSMAEGSTVVLTKACRRLLLSQQPKEHSNCSGPRNSGNYIDFARVGPPSQANSTRWAIDGLAFLSLSGEVKETITTDSELLAAIFHVAQLGFYDAAFPLASLLANLTNSFEEKEVTPEMLELAKFSKQHIPQKHEADEPKVVTERRRVMIDAGLPTCLYHLTTDLVTGTVAAQPGIREIVARIFLSCTDVVDCRGLLVSAGAGKALLNLALDMNTDGGKMAASQALAKLTITSDPRITFAGQRSLEVIRPILQLLHLDCTALQNFEGLLALTNLSSLDEAHRSRILMDKGLPSIEHYMFEEHVQLRRAATECFANLAQHHAVTVSCGGTLPLDEHCSIGKGLVTASSTERIKLLMLFCLDVEDIFLVRAAAGALATMSYDAGIIKKITEVSNWLEILQAVAANPAPAVQHRGVFIIRNMIIEGDRSLAEYLSNSNMLEVLMALSQLPDITAEFTLPPACIVLAQGRPMTVIRREAGIEREKTKTVAKAALEKLAAFNFIRPTR